MWFKQRLSAIHSEEGHAMPLLGALVGAVGVIVLGIGAANDNDMWTIIGAVVAAIGPFVYDVLRHTQIDYELFRRTSKPE